MSKTFDQGKDEIVKLCRYFEVNRQSFLALGVKEAHVRQSLIDPFFEALGWDVRNAAMAAPQYREVIPEDSLEVEGQQKAPDYAFRVGTLLKFFAEAKKCGINILADPYPAHQLRSYGWSAKVALSILTDFDELGVYDCASRPRLSDKASHARIQYFRFDEYPDRWREIWDVFSREAVWSGAFDQYAASKRKRGTSEVDSEFLKDIEGWRDVLARNLALRNGDLSADDLNAAVQRIIDRIIFLRMAEDRGLEPDGQLLKLCEQPDLYIRFMQGLCRKADEKYNSGLFHFQKEPGISDAPDTLTPRLVVDDKVLKPILQSLYFAYGSPYHFGVLPVEILGTVYERFLGKVIRLTAGHQAKVELKPEVRKAGGVYYTPAYIVDYIVKTTVGRQVEGKSPADLAGSKNKTPLRVLDMACGSGSFLLGAYQFLLDHCLKWYEDNQPDKHTKAVFRDAKGAWRLTIAERKRILITHLHGVDIDQQAVEVTKLSLLLKALEDENDASLTQQMRLIQERALPNLADNIKCGNSLISPDYFTGKLIPDADELQRVNPFDWAQGFPDAMETGGFDCIIGNPPYVRIQAMKEWAPLEVEIYKELFKSARTGSYDIYVVFIEQGLSLLNAKGRLGFICPHKFFNSKYGEPVRALVAEGRHLSHVVHFGDQQVFDGATTYTCLLFLDRSPAVECRFVKVDRLNTWRISGVAVEGKMKAGEITSSEWNFAVGADALRRLREIRSNLGEVAHIFQGLVTGADKIFVPPTTTDIENGLTRPFLTTGDLTAYALPIPTARIIFPYEIMSGKAQLIAADILEETYPKGWLYLVERREDLMNRERGKWRHSRWYAFGRSQNLTQMEAMKLVIQVTAQKPTVLLDEGGLYMTGGGSGPFYGIRPKSAEFPIKYLLGILNSALFGWIVKAQSTNLRGGYTKFSKQYIETAPIITPDAAGSEKVKSLVSQVDNILSLRKHLAAANSEAQKGIIQRQIDTTETEINRLVYDLYGLTEEEIKIVEGR